MHKVLNWITDENIDCMSLKPNAQALDSTKAGSGIFEKNVESAETVQVTKTLMQPELHQFTIECLVDHEEAKRKAFEESASPPQVFCNNGPWLNVGHCEMENGLLTCHGYGTPENILDGCQEELSDDSWVTVPFLALQHSTTLANMSTIQNSTVHHLLDSAIRSTNTYLEENLGKVVTPLAEYLIGIVSQIQKVMREQTATCVEQSEHSLYVLRDAATRAADDDLRGRILRQSLIQGDKLYVDCEAAESKTLDKILAELKITEPSPPDIPMEVSDSKGPNKQLFHCFNLKYTSQHWFNFFTVTGHTRLKRLFWTFNRRTDSWASILQGRKRTFATSKH